MSPFAREVVYTAFTEDLAGLRTRAFGLLDFPETQCRGEEVSLIPLRVSSGVSPDSRLARPPARERTKSKLRVLPSSLRCKADRASMGAAVSLCQSVSLLRLQSLDLRPFAWAILRGPDGIWRPPSVEPVSCRDGGTSFRPLTSIARSGFRIGTRSSRRSSGGFATTSKVRRLQTSVVETALLHSPSRRSDCRRCSWTLVRAALLERVTGD